MSPGLYLLFLRPEHQRFDRRPDVPAFGEHIASDLNTAAALGVVFDLVRALNSTIDAGQVGGSDAEAIRETFDRFDRVLGVLALRRAEDDEPPIPLAEIEQHIEARRAARRARNFAEADRIRANLESRGIILEDTGSVTRWKRKMAGTALPVARYRFPDGPTGESRACPERAVPHASRRVGTKVVSGNGR